VRRRREGGDLVEVKRVDGRFQFRIFFLLWRLRLFGFWDMRLLEILNPIARGGGGVRAGAGGELLLFPSFYLLLHQFGGKFRIRFSSPVRSPVTPPRAVSLVELFSGDGDGQGEKRRSEREPEKRSRAGRSREAP
jgi:hypothetical protein